jgi:hypothetical protein
MLSARQSAAQVAEDLTLEILSRQPTAEERRIIEGHFHSGAGSRREAAVDVAWALINSAEFLFRH